MKAHHELITSVVLVYFFVSGVFLTAVKAEVTMSDFGKTKDGQSVEQYTLTNSNGMTIKVMTRGATLTNVIVPDKNGEMADVVLGFDDVSGYEGEGNQYFGVTTGRVANRIKEGKFLLHGVRYTLAVNNGVNALHGGTKRSLDKVIWSANPMNDNNAVEFSYSSPDKEEHYPGKLDIKVTFILTDNNEIIIVYHATTDKDTPVNITNHSYFNLAGEGAGPILDHVLQLNAPYVTPTDETLIPTGEIVSVKGTAVDFLEPMEIGARIKDLDDSPYGGYDHNFVLGRENAEGMILAAVVKEPQSGRVLKCYTDQIGIQFYSGNFLHSQPGKGGKMYAYRSAFCLETQKFPNSVNIPWFPSTILKPGEEYRHHTMYEFSVEK